MPFCRECGNQIGEADKFCKQCGATQQPGAPPAGQQPLAQPPPVQQTPPAQAAPAAAAAPANRTPLYIFIGVLSVLLIAGITVGIVFLVKGSSEEKAVEEADKYVAEALGYIDEVDAIEEDLISETKDLDFSVGTEQFQAQVESIQTQLADATVKLDAAASSLEKIDKPSLPDWWDAYIALLEKAYEEKRQAYQEWDEFITRMAEMDEFSQVYQTMVQNYTAALDTVIQATYQHDEEQYAAAKATCYTALDQLSQARAQMDIATQMEPGVDLSQVSGAISQVEGFIVDFQRLCDLANAGSWEEHNALIDQLISTFDSLPRSISFDITSWIAAERDRYIASIEEHLEKEAEYRTRAGEIWEENN